MRRVLLIAVLASVTLAAGFGLERPRSTHAAGPIYVTAGVDDSNSAAGCSLREAISSANSDSAIGGCTTGAGDDTIVLPAGNYVQVGASGEDGNASGDLDITANLTITGDGAASTVVANGGLDRVFHIRFAQVFMSDISITGGMSPNQGGGILNDPFSSLTLTDSSVSGNTAGGLFFGAGISNQASLTLNRSTISGNSTAAGVGGAIHSQGPMVIDNSTISGNSGGLNIGCGSSCPVVDVSNTTIADNNFGSSNGGLRVPGGVVNLKNSILARNGPRNCFTFGGGSILSVADNLVTDSTCPGFTEVSSSQLNLGALAVNAPGETATHALGPGSAAIDGVSDCTTIAGGVVATDERGISRPFGTACDIGAYEYSLPGSITICKQTEPGGSSQTFNFGGHSGVAVFIPFTLFDNGPCHTISADPGDYFFEELVGSLPPGWWSVANIECIYDNFYIPNFHIGTAFEAGMTSISFVLLPGANVTCTFTNQECTNCIAVGGTTQLLVDESNSSAAPSDRSRASIATTALAAVAAAAALMAAGWYVLRRGQR